MLPGRGHPQLLWATRSCLTILTAKNLSLRSSLDIPSSSLKAISPHCVITCPHKKSLSIFSVVPSGTGRPLEGPPGAFSMLKSPNSPSLSSQERCSRPLLILMALHWALSGMPRSPLYWCEGSELYPAPQMWLHQCGAEGKDQSLSLLEIMHPGCH